MAQYQVVQDGSGWKVLRDGVRHYDKTYRTKQAALDAAYRAADAGDSVQGQRVDGTWGIEHTKLGFGPGGDSG